MRNQTRLGLTAAAGATLVAAALVMDAVDAAHHVVTADIVADLTLLPAVVALGVMGPVIVRRRPENRIGRLFCVDFALAGLIMLADGYAATAAHPSRASRPHDDLAAWVTGFVWVPIVVTLLAVLPIVFPTGSPATRRWRWAERLAWIQIAALTVGLAFSPNTIDGYPLRNPVTPSPHAFFTALSLVGFILLLPCVALGALAIAVRYRRARGVERQQLKWITFGAGVAAFGFVLAPAAVGAGFHQAFNITVPLAITAVVLAAGVAVLRYRLYDIDRLISRTLLYGALSLVLGAAYAGLVLAGQALFSTFAGGSKLAVAVSTLVVAALFLPLRAGLQRFIDRRFYRRRYDAQRTLDDFAVRLRQQVDMGVLGNELMRAASDTMEPAHVTIWLRRTEAP